MNTTKAFDPDAIGSGLANEIAIHMPPGTEVSVDIENEEPDDLVFQAMIDMTPESVRQ